MAELLELHNAFQAFIFCCHALKKKNSSAHDSAPCGNLNSVYLIRYEILTHF